MNYWWRSSSAAVPSSSGASTSAVQLRLLSPPITTVSSCSRPRIRSRTRTPSGSLQPPGSVCKHRRFALLKCSYKANQPERNIRPSVVRLILTLARFASLSVRTDLWGPLLASFLVENSQWTLLDIMSARKWFGLPRTTLHKQNNRPTIPDTFIINGKSNSNISEIAEEFNNFFVNIGEQTAKNLPQSTNSFSDYLNGNYAANLFMFPTCEAEILHKTTHLKASRYLPAKVMITYPQNFLNKL